MPSAKIATIRTPFNCMMGARDATGILLKHGDLCVRTSRGKVKFCIFLSETYRIGATGRFGRFLANGDSTAYAFASTYVIGNVLSGKTKYNAEIKKLIKDYYE